jgi:hypothetical protein
LASAAEAGYAPLGRRLYLPKDWADDSARREKCHVPPEIEFQEKWQIALDLLDRSLPDLPHGWIVGDDEFGRVSAFRAALRERRERYVLDVPCNTLVRDLERRRPRRRRAGRGRKREVPFQRVDVWAKGQPESRWVRLTVRDGEKGPLQVDAMAARVCAKQDGRVGPEERLTHLATLAVHAMRGIRTSRSGHLQHPSPDERDVVRDFEVLGRDELGRHERSRPDIYGRQWSMIVVNSWYPRAPAFQATVLSTPVRFSQFGKADLMGIESIDHCKHISVVTYTS